MILNISVSQNTINLLKVLKHRFYCSKILNQFVMFLHTSIFKCDLYKLEDIIFRTDGTKLTGGSHYTRFLALLVYRSYEKL